MEGDGLTIGIRRDQLGVIRAYLEDIGSDSLLSFMGRNLLSPYTFELCDHWFRG